MACAQVQHQTTGSPHVEELSTMSLFTAAAAAAAAQDPFAGICTSGRVAGKYAPCDDQMHHVMIKWEGTIKPIGCTGVLLFSHQSLQ